jgi:hypothetical protein
VGQLCRPYHTLAALKVRNQRQPGCFAAGINFESSSLHVAAFPICDDDGERIATKHPRSSILE